jgi:hypothetical protein
MAKKDKAKALDQQATDAGATRERIAHRAFELYEERGRVDGFDAQDWFLAEQEVLGQTERADTLATGERGEGRRPARIGGKAAKQP